MENKIIFDIIIVFGNTHICPPTRRREGSVFRNLHSRERFRKDAYLVIVFTKTGVGVEQTEGKKSPFSNKNGYVWTGL